ncbi:MAG: hypothetical protein ACREDS_13530 [Limisphaerales bacterium]
MKKVSASKNHNWRVSLKIEVTGFKNFIRRLRGLRGLEIKFIRTSVCEGILIYQPIPTIALMRLAGFFNEPESIRLMSSDAVPAAAWKSPERKQKHIQDADRYLVEMVPIILMFLRGLGD